MAKPVKSNKNIKGSKDVTIYDFANSTVSTNRPKKSENSITTVVKNELDIKEHWYDDDEVEDGQSTSSQCTKKSRSKKQKCSDDSGINYPVDIWFLISEHIAPEDVGRFAGICQATLSVVRSVQFWKSLYKRYYKKEKLTPEFQPECLLRHFGLRTAVIRALYLMYPPFTNRTKLTLIKPAHPDFLIGMTMVGLVCKPLGKQGSDILYYYFKFKRNGSNQSSSHHQNKTKEESVVDMLNDINANPDEDHIILMAISKQLICVPPIMGMKLRHASVTLSKVFCSDRLQMSFGDPLDGLPPQDIPIHKNSIVIDPVCNISLLNWWHPMYIRSNSIPDLDNDLWDL